MDNKPPEFKKALPDLVPCSQDLLSRAKSLVIGGTVATLGLLGISTAPLIAGGVPPPIASSAAITVANRQKKRARLVLALGQVSTTLDPQHRSHSSHSSHASHYSSSSGTPSYRPPPPTPPPAQAGASAAGTHIPVFVINKLDRVKRSFATATEDGLKQEFFYRDDTLIVQGGSSARVDDLAETPGRLPLTPGRKVRVEWKMSQDGTKRIATKVTMLN